MTRLDQCRVTDKDHWNRCLIEAFQESQLGFCATNFFLSEYHPIADNEGSCCPEDDSNLCFETLGKRLNYCLKARRVTETSSGRCHHQDDCPNKDDNCISLSVNDSSRLVRIERKDAEPVLYLGHYGQLRQSLSISNYTPRTRLFSPAFIQFIEEMLAYIASFSAGFAVLNVVPCIAMDGQHIVTAIVELLPGNSISPAKQRLTQLSIYGGTALVIINVSCGLYNLFL